MARIDNLNNFLTDVANAIRKRKKTTSLILASNFDAEIESIKSDETGSSQCYINDCSYLFYNSSRLDEVENILKICKPTNTSNMFRSCKQATILDLRNLDLSRSNTMANMFTDCSNLTNIDLSDLDISEVTTMIAMFSGCTKLTDINLSNLSAEKVINVNNMFTNCTSLENIIGFPNFGKGYLTTTAANSTAYALNLSASSNLTYDSLMNVINSIYDIASAGCKTQKLILGNNLEKLTQEEIQIATDKGWTVS